MVKDIFNMSKAEIEAKFKAQHQKVREENARFGLPVSGYSPEHKSVVNKYIDGRIEIVKLKPEPKVLKSQLSTGF